MAYENGVYSIYRQQDVAQQQFAISKLQKAGLDVIIHGKLEARLAKDAGHDPYCRCSGDVAAVVPERLLLARHRRLVPLGKVSNRASLVLICS